MSRRVSSRGETLAVFFAALVLAGSSTPAGAAVPLPPAPDRYVTDRAGVLPTDRAGALNASLERFEKETSNQIQVWTDRRVPDGTTLEEFTVAAARKWRAGEKGKNNGAVLFVFTEDRKMRIEVGYGLEGTLPDAIAHRIQEEQILPRFRQGDYAGGIEAGVQGMMAAARGEYRGTGTTVDERKGRRRTSIGGCSPFLFLLFFLFLPLLRLSRWRTYGSRGWRSGGGGWAALGGFLGGGGFGGGGGFSGGGGGFSGGGGSFGGGGSSGSW